MPFDLIIFGLDIHRFCSTVRRSNHVLISPVVRAFWVVSDPTSVSYPGAGTPASAGGVQWPPGGTPASSAGDGGGR